MRHEGVRFCIRSSGSPQGRRGARVPLHAPPASGPPVSAVQYERWCCLTHRDGGHLRDEARARDAGDAGVVEGFHGALGAWGGAGVLLQGQGAALVRLYRVQRLRAAIPCSAPSAPGVVLMQRLDIAPRHSEPLKILSMCFLGQRSER